MLFVKKWNAKLYCNPCIPDRTHSGAMKMQDQKMEGPAKRRHCCSCNMRLCAHQSMWAERERSGNRSGAGRKTDLSGAEQWAGKICGSKAAPP